MTFKTIVAAVGYADEAEKVVRQAKYIADKHRAKLILIHAVETVHIIAGPEAYGYVEMVPDADEAKAAAVKNILQIIQRAGIASQDIKLVINVGITKNEILDCAKEENADLIIVGSHEKSFAGLLLGSTANAVLHKSASDVLVTKLGIDDDVHTARQYKQILLAIDFMPEVEKVIEKAKELAIQHDARLSLVHVINRAPAFEMPLSLFEKEIIEKIEWQFKELVTTYELDSVHCELLLGSPAREITDYAAKNNVDLVVMGSHGRHGIGILFGSTANSVFHRSACDVLAIRL